MVETDEELGEEEFWAAEADVTEENDTGMGEEEALLLIDSTGAPVWADGVATLCAADDAPADIIRPLQQKPPWLFNDPAADLIVRYY